MATLKPRITVTLSENQHRLLLTLADLQSVSMSSIVADLIDSVYPALERVAVILKAAKDAPESVKAELRETVQEAEKLFLPAAKDLMVQLDILVDSVPVSSGGRRTPEKPALSSRKKPEPPPTNRGVSNTSKLSTNKAVSPMKTAKKVGG